MSVKVASNRFIVSSLNQRVGFYQQLLSKVSSFQELGNKLVREAETAQAFRHIERLQGLGEILSNFPVKEFRLIGQYYLGWCGYCRGENPREIFEMVAEKSKTYKIKALTSMGAMEDASGDYGLAAEYYSEALKYADSPSLIVEAARGVALLKAKEGYNHKALKELERIWPIVRLADSHTYYQYLNSFAVELGEAGRVQEANNVCRIVLASPFAFAYPEWHDTARENAERGYRSRGQVSVAIGPFAEKPQPKKLLHWPKEDTQKPAYDPLPNAATVTEMAAWKKKMGKEPNGEDVKLPKNMNVADMVVMLMNIITRDDDPDAEKMRKVLEYTIKVFSEK